MVATMGVDEDEERRLDERPMHQGCMAGFLHLFDRPQILSGRRLHNSQRRLTSFSSGSATPSERSMPLDRATPAPSSPDMTPPAAPRPSLQLPPPLDLKDGAAGGFPSWRLPRLSLDSRAVVDARGKLRPREIRTSTAAGAPPSPSGGGDDRRSPSVVARLMGLDALPHGEAAAAGECGQQYGGAAVSPASLRRSASERVPTHDPARFRFVDPSFFERPAAATPPLPPPHHRPSSPATAAAEEAAAAMRRAAADPVSVVPRGGAFQRRSRFDAHDVFPEPAKRSSSADPAAAAQGEIALYGEIERRLRKRGIAEPARDLETLKQILEALQLKGLLHHHHTTTAPPPPQAQARTPPPPPPPIVVMRPSSRATPPPPPLAGQRRLRVDIVDRARRPRSPDLLAAASPARSPASSPAARRGSLSPQRRVSPAAQSPKQQHQQHQLQSSPVRKPISGFDSAAARSRIARRAAAHNAAAAALSSPDDEAASTPTFSDGGSSSSLSASSSRWDFDPLQADPRTDRGLLERCGKLLSSIQAFTGGDGAVTDQQPSPVSVLDAAAFLADEDSPPSSSSSASKRAIDFRATTSITVRHPKPPTAVSDPEEDDEWAPPSRCVDDPEHAYVAELVRLLSTRSPPRDPAEAYRALEQRNRQRGGGGETDTWGQGHRRLLLCGAVGEALERQRAACPWEPAAWLRGAELVAHVWAEVRRCCSGEHAAVVVDKGEEEEEADLNDVTCRAIRRDLAADSGRWGSSVQKGQKEKHGAEVAEAVLQIERLVFKDLVADTIRELADADRPSLMPRRKLVF